MNSLMVVITSLLGLVPNVVWGLILYHFGSLLTKHQDLLEYLGLNEIPDYPHIHNHITTIGKLFKIFAIVKIAFAVISIFVRIS